MPARQLAAFDSNSPLAQVDRCQVCLQVRHLEHALCAGCRASVSPRVAGVVHHARRNPQLAQACSARLSAEARAEFVNLLGNMPGLVGPVVAKCSKAQAGPRPVRYPVLRPASGE